MFLGSLAQWTCCCFLPPCFPPIAAMDYLLPSLLACTQGHNTCCIYVVDMLILCGQPNNVSMSSPAVGMYWYSGSVVLWKLKVFCAASSAEGVLLQSLALSRLYWKLLSGDLSCGLGGEHLVSLACEFLCSKVRRTQALILRDRQPKECNEVSTPLLLMFLAFWNQISGVDLHWAILENDLCNRRLLSWTRQRMCVAWLRHLRHPSTEVANTASLLPHPHALQAIQEPKCPVVLEIKGTQSIFLRTKEHFESTISKGHNHWADVKDNPKVVVLKWGRLCWRHGDDDATMTHYYKCTTLPPMDTYHSDHFQPNFASCRKPPRENIYC